MHLTKGISIQRPTALMQNMPGGSRAVMGPDTGTTEPATVAEVTNGVSAARLPALSRAMDSTRRLPPRFLLQTWSPFGSSSVTKVSQGPAPVIEVSGRLYPVEIRYRPVEPEDATPRPGAAQQTAAQKERGARELMDAIADAVDELCRLGRPGDHRPDVERIVSGLVRDGLAERVAEMIRLPA